MPGIGSNNLQEVITVIVDERNRSIRLPEAINRHASLACCDRDTLHCDTVERVAVAVAQLELVPSRREARHESQFSTLEPEAQERFNDQAVGPRS
jgi:hypothetical protein